MVSEEVIRNIKNDFDRQIYELNNKLNNLEKRLHYYNTTFLDKINKLEQFKNNMFEEVFKENSSKEN